MASNSKGSGRIYMMVGLIASIVIPLAFVAPGLSRQMTDQDVQRLGPVEPVADGEYISQVPDRAMPVASGGDSPTFGAAGSFGSPTMIPEPTANLTSDQLPQYRPPESAAASSTAPAQPAAPAQGGARSRADEGAQLAGAQDRPTTRSWSRPAGKANAPPLTRDPAPIVR